jgi:CRISPR-associated protein Cas1
MLLEICEHGSVLKRSHDCFIVRTPKEQLEFPAEKIEAIIITANALVSTQAVALCLEKEIQLVFADWSGRPFGRFWASAPGRATEIRRGQYLNQDSQLAFEISKEIVKSKLAEQRRLLISLKKNRKVPTEALKQSVRNLQSALAKVNSLQFAPQFKQTLLGLEGFAASEYFKAISSILPTKYTFDQRSRSPARDEFNAILNYVYGYAYSDIEKIVIISGLDPNAGIYHADLYGKPTLVFDIIEMFRPRVDRLVVKMFTKRIVRDSWFEDRGRGSEGGIYLSKEGRRNIIRQYVTEESHLIQKDTWTYCRKLIERFLGEA